MASAIHPPTFLPAEHAGTAPSPVHFRLQQQPHLQRCFEEFLRKNGGCLPSTGTNSTLTFPAPSAPMAPKHALPAAGGGGVFSSSLSSSTLSSSSSTTATVSPPTSTPPSPSFSDRAGEGHKTPPLLPSSGATNIKGSLPPPSHASGEGITPTGSVISMGYRDGALSGNGGYLFLGRLQPENCKPHVALMLAQPVNAASSSSTPASHVVIKIIKQSWQRHVHKIPGQPLGELAAFQVLSQAPEHPHIVPLTEAMVDEEHQYLVFPYVDGGELFGLVAQHPNGLATHDACRYFMQIVSGLLHMKRHGLAHGDVSLENVMISKGKYTGSSPICRLIDLEMARYTAASTQSSQHAAHNHPHIIPPTSSPSIHGIAVDTRPSPNPTPVLRNQQLNARVRSVIAGGKAGYIDPQVFQGLPDSSETDFSAATRPLTMDWHAADVWSLGVCLYIMLTGRHLYDSYEDHSYEILASGRTMELIEYYAKHFGLHVPALAVDLICLMLRPNAADRPTLEQIQQHPFIKANSGPPAPSSLPFSPSPPPPHHHHHGHHREGQSKHDQNHYYNPLRSSSQPHLLQQQVPQSLLDILVQHAMREDESNGKLHKHNNNSTYSTPTHLRKPPLYSHTSHQASAAVPPHKTFIPNLPINPIPQMPPSPAPSNMAPLRSRSYQNSNSNPNPFPSHSSVSFNRDGLISTASCLDNMKKSSTTSSFGPVLGRPAPQESSLGAPPGLSVPDDFNVEDILGSLSSELGPLARWQQQRNVSELPYPGAREHQQQTTTLPAGAMRHLIPNLTSPPADMPSRAGHSNVPQAASSANSLPPIGPYRGTQNPAGVIGGPVLNSSNAAGLGSGNHLLSPFLSGSDSSGEHSLWTSRQ